jgi:hypothetical protein
MKDVLEIRPANPSRRSMLRILTGIVGGAAVLGAVSVGDRAAAAPAKMAQKAVGYQATPKGAQRCDNCKQFESPSSCKIVEGVIDPAGWCRVYVK